MSADKKYYCLSIGAHGFSLYGKTTKTDHGTSKESRSGYQVNEKTYNMLADGCLVIDTRPCKDRDNFVSAVLRAPLVNVDLMEGETDAFRFRYDSVWMQTGWAGMLSLGKVGGLDYVAPDVYAAYWQQKGAKVGIKTGGIITWIHGAATVDETINKVVDRDPATIERRYWREWHKARKEGRPPPPKPGARKVAEKEVKPEQVKLI